MNWMQRLYETYETCEGREGLLPIYHALQKAHIEIAISEEGEFRRAIIIDGIETVVPATENSAGRTNRPSPHGLCDKLQYVAADCPRAGGVWQDCFKLYLKQLEDWCALKPYPKVKAILAYVKKERVVADLLKTGILHADPLGNLLDRWDHDTASPEIFRVLSANSHQSDALVRWRVETVGDAQSAVWEDRSLMDSWKEFEKSRQIVRGLCFVCGEQDSPVAQNHPKRIRHGGDGAKLISSNDESGYTFRGRFGTAAQAATISSEVTQKAHSALRWLIERQAYRHGSQIVLAWALSGKSVPDPLGDTHSLFEELHEADAEDNQSNGYSGDAGQAFATRLGRTIAGYRAQLGITDNIVLLGLDSATPGRLSITFYRELTGSEFLERIEKWHRENAWYQTYSNKLSFVGAPAPKDIAIAAFGRRLDEKLCRATVERLLPCIIDGRPIAFDLVQASVRRASNRAGMDNWEWEKTLGITCSLVRGYHHERSYQMALEPERRTRDYLYGRLLAIAEHLEGRALYISVENRDTTAGRLMQRFSDHPYSTWRNIEKALPPYISRLRAKGRSRFLHVIDSLLDEIHCLFDPSKYTDDSPLSGEYLLGYHCQRRALRSPGSNEDEHDSEDTIEQGKDAEL